MNKIDLSMISDNMDLSDIELNIVIQSLLDSHYYDGVTITVNQWRLDHYEELRRWSYPKISEYYDAQIKINSGIPAMITEGEDQLEIYIENCLDVKTRFPKE